jgi:c-di-GMP-binding flagellar brake protein YcgR
MINRRKETRYRVRDGVFAIDTDEPQRLGEVIDISRGGIAFRYMDGASDPNPLKKLNIFSSTHSLFLNDYSFESVSDVQIEGHPSSAIRMRRHGGKFVSLTPQQQEQLDNFINLHCLYPG